MSNRVLICVVGVLACAVPRDVSAQDKPEPALAMPKPGPEHVMLQEWVGNWTYVNKWRMAPDQPWIETPGTEKVESVCGGFWLAATSTADFQGMAFEGRMIFGFDQQKKKFVGTWFDSFASNLSTMEGDWDAPSKTLTLWSDMFHPDRGKMLKTKITKQVKSRDEHLLRMFVPGADGNDQLIMEIASKRKS